MTKRKKPDYIAQLIEVSDKCMSVCDPRAKRKCTCRQNVKAILRKMGIKIR